MYFSAAKHCKKGIELYKPQQCLVLIALSDLEALKTMWCSSIVVSTLWICIIKYQNKYSFQTHIICQLLSYGCFGNLDTLSFCQVPMLFVLNMCNFMCLDLNNFCCFSQVPPVLEPARPLLGRNKGRGTSKQDEKEGGEDCVLEKHIVLFFFFKALESRAEIESTLLLTLVMDLENVSFPWNPSGFLEFSTHRPCLQSSCGRKRWLDARGLYESSEIHYASDFYLKTVHAGMLGASIT